MTQSQRAAASAWCCSRSMCLTWAGTFTCLVWVFSSTGSLLLPCSLLTTSSWLQEMYIAVLYFSSHLRSASSYFIYPICVPDEYFLQCQSRSCVFQGGNSSEPCPSIMRLKLPGIPLNWGQSWLDCWAHSFLLNLASTKFLATFFLPK